MSSSPDINLDVLRGQGGVPTSPFEIQITKAALQARIDAGEISHADIDILRRSYRWMTISTGVGWAAGIPVFLYLRRRMPQQPFSLRLFASMTVATVGSFLGFAAGGAAGAMEVHNKMADAPRKLKVFQQIVIDSKRAIEEQKRGLPPGTFERPPPAGQPRVGVDGSSSSAPRDPVPSDTVLSDTAPSSAPDSAPAGPVAEKITAATGSTWDRLRSSRPEKPQPLSAGDELARQQAEFDAMLERERRGGDDLDKWK